VQGIEAEFGLFQPEKGVLTSARGFSDKSGRMKKERSI